MFSAKSTGSISICLHAPPTSSQGPLPWLVRRRYPAGFESSRKRTRTRVSKRVRKSRSGYVDNMTRSGIRKQRPAHTAQKRKESCRHVTSFSLSQIGRSQDFQVLVMMQNGQIRVNKGRLILISLVNTLNLMHNNPY